MPTKNRTPSGSVATSQRPTLDCSQDILEPQKQVLNPAAGDAPATPQHTVKSIFKTPGKPTWNLPPVPRLSLGLSQFRNLPLVG